ncbi:unnamed protein product, partial [Tenebrio molitor]
APYRRKDRSGLNFPGSDISRTRSGNCLRSTSAPFPPDSSHESVILDGACWSAAVMSS